MKKKYPDVYLFNPTCEYAVANGSANWQPNQLIKRMEYDLETLPLFFANPQDHILVNKLPSENYLETLKNVGVKIPNFILLKNALTDTTFQHLPKNSLMPWGWSPVVHKLLSPLKQSCSKDFHLSPISEWKNDYKFLYSKKFALEIQKKLLAEINSEILLPNEQTGEICNTKEDFEALISKWGKIMVKAPWSSSGRGLQAITKTPVHSKVWEKLLGIVHEQGYAIVEPYLDKVFDVAFQFKSEKGKISFIGTSYFNTDKKGQYKGNYINGLPDNIDSNLHSFIIKINSILEYPLSKILRESKLATDYEGFFGVDMLIYSDADKKLRINPCLEINVRQNMGLLSLKLRNLLDNKKKGMFKIYFNPGKLYITFKSEMEKKYPLRVKNNKIETGFLSLTEAMNDSLFGAYLLV